MVTEPSDDRTEQLTRTNHGFLTAVESTLKRFRSTQLQCYEPAVSNPLNCGPFTPMRLGAALFAAPLGLAIWQERPAGSVVLGLVMLTTFATHRPRLAWTQGIREDADLMAVISWYIYNTFLTIESIINFSKHGYTPVRLAFLILAIAGAGGCVACDFARNKFPYRSPWRDFLHVSMHFSGAAGTCLLIMAAKSDTALKL